MWEGRGDAPPPPPEEWGVPDEVVVGRPRIALMHAIRHREKSDSETPRDKPQATQGDEVDTVWPSPAASGPSPPLLASKAYHIRDLTERFPPKFMCTNKVRLHEECLQRVPPLPSEQQLTFTRFGPAHLPRRVRLRGVAPAVMVGVFDYAQSSGIAAEWYVNFADRRLFGFYEGSLFAQDEMQVQEHPVLASLRRCLEKEAGTDPVLAPLTVGTEGPTPCLVEAVPRSCSIGTARSEEAPLGLYGNAFARVPFHAVVAATTFHVEPQLTNVLAMEAPKPSRGEYTHGQVKHALS